MTRVAFLWHMHQPFYQDLLTGEHVLHWVRLHALKDYWGMVALLREFPSVKATFNLVPSLLVQVEAFAAEQAKDRHLELGLKPAASLTEEERGFCIEHFFHAHRPTMIDCYPRYSELLDRRGARAVLEVDGGTVLAGLLPDKAMPAYEQYAQYGIRANAIAAGTVRTERQIARYEGKDFAEKQGPAARERAAGPASWAHTVARHSRLAGRRRRIRCTGIRAGARGASA